MKEWKKLNNKDINFTHETIDAESESIQCICGYGEEAFDFQISIYKGDDLVDRCPKCGREYYFEREITVYVREP